MGQASRSSSEETGDGRTKSGWKGEDGKWNKRKSSTGGYKWYGFFSMCWMMRESSSLEEVVTGQLRARGSVIMEKIADAAATINAPGYVWLSPEYLL